MKRTGFLLIGLALAAAGCAGALHRTGATFNIRDFGAVGDGTNQDTVAFQKTLDACAAAGGGNVVVPAGTYLIGSVQIGNRTMVRLAKGSVLRGSPDPADYPQRDIRWEGRWQPGRGALIRVENVDHTGITGPGRIEGNPAVAAPQNPRGAVVLEPIACRDVRWEGFTVTQGGNWATHPTYCTDVLIKNVTIRGERDGIDIDSCEHVRIEDCDLDTGDDAISLKSGRGREGVRIGRPTADVRITRCRLRGRHFACIGIGSETSGGIRQVRMDHCQMDSHTFGVYVKSRLGRGGVIEDITGNELEIRSGGFLRVNLISSGNRNTADDPVDGLAGYPVGRNFAFSNIRMAGTTVAEVNQISPEKPLDGLILQNISGTATRGIALQNVRHAVLRHLHITGCPGALLTVTNVSGTGLDAAQPH